MILVVNAKEIQFKLGAVKFLKRLTNLSLLECKQLIEKETFSVRIKDDQALFNEEIKCCDFEWTLLDDTQSKRQDKLIHMDIADSSTIIDRLIQLHSALEGSHLDHLKKVYSYLSKEQLLEIFSERQKEIQEKFYNKE